MSKEIIKTNTQTFIIDFLDYLRRNALDEVISRWNTNGVPLFGELFKEREDIFIPCINDKGNHDENLDGVLEIYSCLRNLYFKTWKLEGSYILVDFTQDFAVTLSKVPGVETSFKCKELSNLIYPAFTGSLRLTPVGTSLASPTSFEILTDRLLECANKESVIAYTDYWNENVDTLVKWILCFYEDKDCEKPSKTELTHLLSIGQGEQNMMGLLTIPYVIGIIPNLNHLQEELAPLLELRGVLVKYIIELSNITGNNGNYEVVHHSTCLGPKRSIHSKYHTQYVIWE